MHGKRQVASDPTGKIREQVIETHCLSHDLLLSTRTELHEFQ